jgi:hypothetical protein
MAEEQGVVDKADEQALGAPEGVRNRDLSDGHSNKGPNAPAEPSNAPPVKEPTAEEKAATEKAEAEAAAKAATEAAEKEAADKAAADAKAAEIEESKKAYPTYGDETADAVIDLLKESNVTPAEADDIFREAVEKGTLEGIDWSKLEEKMGKSKANLVKTGVTEYYNRINSSVKAVVEAVTSVVGSKENFDKVAKWAQAKETADPAFGKELDSYRKMLDSNEPTTAKLAAEALLKAYNADPKNSSLDVRRIDGDSAPTETGFVPLSRADYIKGMHEANAKGDQAAVKLLNDRRLQTIRLGK